MTMELDDVEGKVDEVQDKLSDQAGRVGERVTSAMEGFRDRTADVVRADGGSIFREVSKLGDRVDDAQEAVTDRIDAAESTITDRLEELVSIRKRTTLPRKLFWVLVGAGVGVAATYLADPDRGQARRAQLSDQAVARARDVADQAGGTAKRTVDKAKGGAIEAAKELTPDDVPDDPKLLEQRVKSEVLGHRDDVDGVVLRIDGPGAVALKGTVDASSTEAELLAAVAEVDGVIDVRSELSVRGS